MSTAATPFEFRLVLFGSQKQIFFQQQAIVHAVCQVIIFTLECCYTSDLGKSLTSTRSSEKTYYCTTF